jgi:competence protein ComEA
MKRLALAVFSTVLFSTAQAQDLPKGPGQTELTDMCGSCHGLDIVISINTSRDGWAGIVDSMVARGAVGTDAEIETVINYLAKFYGEAVNVNKATAADLQSKLELTAEEAEAIVKHRESNGNFAAWADLEKVSGLDIKKIEPLKSRIRF